MFWFLLKLAAQDADIHARRLDATIATLEVLEQTPPARTAGDVLSVQLPRLRGKPVQRAFDRLGYPDRKIAVDGKTVYIWINEDTNIDGSSLRCTVKIIARARRVIDTDFFGNEGACARFARALDPSFKNRH